MRFLIQRVNYAKVKVNGEVTGQIQKGLLVFIGISKEDTKETADKLLKKLGNMRIFEDSEGKTNLGLQDVSGNVLLVSQFTLYADCRKGNRPSFIHAAASEDAENLYEYIINKCRSMGFPAETGIFGADMKIELENDGPFTIILDSNDLK